MNVNYLGNVKCFNLCLKLGSVHMLCAKCGVWIHRNMIILNQWDNRLGDNYKWVNVGEAPPHNNYLIGSAAVGVLKSVCLKVDTLRKSRFLPSRLFDRSSTCSGASASSGRAGHRLNIAGRSDHRK